MLLLDVLFRYSTITLLLLLGILALKHWKTSPPARYAMLVTTTAAAMLLSTAPPPLQLPPSIFAVVRAFDGISIAAVWWFGLSILKDDFKLKSIHWIGFIAYSSLNLYFRLIEYGFDIPLYPAMSIIIKSIIFVMMGHLVYVALKGRPDDLIEKRRTLRLYFVFGLCVSITLIIIAETLLYPQYDTQLTLLRAVIIFTITLWTFFWLVSFHAEKLSFQPTKMVTQRTNKMDPRDETLRKQLVDTMEVRKSYLEPDLTIRKLSAQLRTPEHRLRVLINQGLGYRNFSEFVNVYRITAVKKAFSDPKNTRIPILTIAMDAGYGSLAPFNRAFLKAEGITPTRFRKDLLVNSNQ